MLFYTIPETRDTTIPHLTTRSGAVLQKFEYSDACSDGFLKEAGNWCVETFEHYYKENYAYEDIRS